MTAAATARSQRCLGSHSHTKQATRIRAKCSFAEIRFASRRFAVNFLFSGDFYDTWKAAAFFSAKYMNGSTKMFKFFLLAYSDYLALVTARQSR